MDPELEKIRNLRLKGLQQQAQLGNPTDTGSNAEQEAQKKAAEEEMRRNILYRLLDSEARERLSRIRLVKEDRATQIEDLIINQARMGYLNSQVDEQMLIKLLSSIPDKSSSTGKITYKRVDKIGEQDESLGDLEELLEN